MNFIYKALLVTSLAAASTITAADSKISYMSPDQAYTVSAIKSIDEIEITITPHDHFFIYANEIKVFEGTTKKEVKPSEIKGRLDHQKFDFDTSKTHKVYKGPVQIYLKNPKNTLYRVHYKGCSFDGICLRPMHKYVKVK